MNADLDLERRIADYYATEAPSRAPDWMLGTVLSTVDTTPQRRVFIRVPWRFPMLNTYAKVAIAAVAVIAVGAIGLAVLRPGPAPGVGGSGAMPSPTVSPSPDPSAPPALTETFTSDVHGISISYPSGWATQPATEPVGTAALHFLSPAGDYIYDRRLNDHLFLGLSSRPIEGQSGDAWATERLNDPDEGCSATREPIVVDGATGVLCDTLALVWVGDRGYGIRLYTSGDEPWLGQYYDQAWFRDVLATVQLDPARAVAPAPSASP